MAVTSSCSLDMKAQDAGRHPQAFTTLRLQPGGINEFVASKYTRIATSPVQTIPILDEIREVIFMYCANDIETKTKPLCAKLFDVLVQLSMVPATPEIMRFRAEILEILWVLNFHFAQDGKIIGSLFKFICDGSIAEMSAAVRIIRQTFEHVVPRDVIWNFGNRTVEAGENKINWLMKNSKMVDNEHYFPFLTLLTVLSFCGKRCETIHTPICELLSNTKDFVLDHPEDTRDNFSKYLPLISIKARIVHSAMLSIDNQERDVKMSFLPDAYMNLSRIIPSGYQSLYDEVASSLVYYLALKTDENRFRRIKPLIDYYIEYAPATPEAYYSIVSVVFKLYEVAVLSFKPTWQSTLIASIVYFAAKLLDMPKTPVAAKIQRFYKMSYDIIRRLTFETDQDAYYYAEFISVIRHSFECIIDDADAHPIDPSVHTMQTPASQDFIGDIAGMFDGYSKMVDLLIKIVRIICEHQTRLDRLKAVHAGRKVDGIATQKATSMKLPLDPFMAKAIVDAYVMAIMALVRLRRLWHKCNLKFSTEPITSNYEKAMKLCDNFLIYNKMFEKLKSYNITAHKFVIELLKSCPNSTIVTRVWQGFLDRLIVLNDTTNIDPSLLRTLVSGNSTLLVGFLAAVVQMVAEALEQNKSISQIVFLVTYSLDKLETTPAQAAERKDVCTKAFLDVFESLRSLVDRTYTRTTEVHKLFWLLTEMAKYVEIFSGKIGFFRSAFSKEYVMKMTSFFRNKNDEDSTLIRFLYMCNKLGPETVENDVVVGYLLSVIENDPLKVLLLLHSIRSRRKDLVSGPEAARKIAPVAYDFMKMPASQRTEPARRLGKHFLPDYEASFRDLNEQHDVILIKDNDHFRMNAHSLLMVLVHAAIESKENDTCWNTLLDLMVAVLLPNERYNMVVGHDFTDPGKIISTVCFSLASRTEFHKKRVSSFFIRLVDRIRYDVKSLAIVLSGIIVYEYMFPKEIFDLGTVDTKEKFDIFLDECIKQMEGSVRDFSMGRVPMCALILKSCKPDIMNMRKLIQFVIRVLSAVNIHEAVEFTLMEKIKFEELTQLPVCIKEIVISMKEIMEQVGEDYAFLLENMKCKGSRNIRLFTAELLTTGSDTDAFSNCVSEILEQEQASIEDKLYVLESCCLLCRCVKYTSSGTSDSVVFLNTYRALLGDIMCSVELDRLPAGGMDIILSSLEPLLTSPGVTDPKFVTDDMVKRILDSIGGTPVIARVILLLYSCSSKERQKVIWTYLVGKVKGDGVVEYGSDIAHTQLGNWYKIVRYWRSLYLLSPQVFVKAVVYQLVGIATEKIEIGSPELMNTTFDTLCSLLAISPIQKYVDVPTLQAQKGELTLFEKVMEAIITIYRRYSIVISQITLPKIAKFILGLSKVEFIRTKFAEVESTAIISMLLCHPDNEVLFNEFMKDAEFAHNMLKFESVPSKVQYHMAMLCMKSDIFMEENIFEQIKKIITFLWNVKISGQLYAPAIMGHLAENYHKLGDRWTEIFEICVVYYDHRNASHAKPFINAILNDSSNNIEIMVRLMVSLDATSFDRACVLLFDQFVRKDPSVIEVILSAVENCHQRVHFLELAYELIPDFRLGANETLALLNACDNDQDRESVYLLWTQTDADSDFLEIFDRFTNSIAVHISTAQKLVTDKLKIPETDHEPILLKLEQMIKKFMRHPATLVCVWKMLINNGEVFGYPTARFWRLIVVQISEIRFYAAKKMQILTILPLCELLTDFFCQWPIPTDRYHDVIVYFGKFLMSTLESSIDNTQIQQKRCAPFMNCCWRLMQRFGHRLGIHKDYYQLFSDMLVKVLASSQEHASHPPLPGHQAHANHPIQPQLPHSVPQFVHEVLFPYIGKVVSTTIRFDQPDIPEKLIDVLLNYVSNAARDVRIVNWPHALHALALILLRDLYGDRIRSRLLEHLDKDIGPAIFSMLWSNEKVCDIKAAITYCLREQMDSHLTIFLTNLVVKTMLDSPNPRGGLQRVFDAMWTAPQGKKLCSTILPALLASPAKSKVAAFVEKLLQSPDICLVVPTIVREDIGTIEWPILAKVAFCTQKYSETALAELSDKVGQLREIVAKVPWSVNVPLAMILHTFLPSGPTVKELFMGMMKVLRADIALNVLDAYSPSPMPPEDSMIRALSFTEESLDRWIQIEFNTLSETQTCDLCDGRKTLEGRPMSRMDLYMHHGMTHQALFSVKECLDKVTNEDLEKVQIGDDMVTRYTVSSISESSANFAESIEQAIRELPPLPLCPYSDKLANFIIACKYKKIHDKKLKFKKPLSHFFSPQVHEAFDGFRKTVSRMLIDQPQPDNESIHAKQHNKSLHQHFAAERPILPSLSDLTESDNPKQILYCLVRFWDNPDWIPIIAQSVKRCLEINQTKDVFIAALYSLISRKHIEIGDILKSLPAHWIPLFHSIGVTKFTPVSHTKAIFSRSSDFRSFLNRLLDIDRSECERGQIYTTTVDFAVSPGFSSLPLSSKPVIIASIDPIIVYDTERIQFTVRTAAGSILPFVITKGPLQTPITTAFITSISQIFTNFVDSAKRFQSLTHTYSVEFRDDYWLTQTDAVPLSSLHDGSTFCKLTAAWNTTFAYRYAAVCAVQILTSSETLSDSDIWINEKTCEIIIRNLRFSSGQHALNPVPRYLDELMITGPLKAGLISAFISLSYSKEKLSVLLASFGISPSAIEIPQSLSIADNPDTEAIIAKIDQLIGFGK